MLPRILAVPFCAALLLGQAKFEHWPGAVYDPAIPTTKRVLGYEPGERIAQHAHLMKYFEALAAAAPSRVRIIEYAKTWEGRKLICALIGSEANLRRLASIQEGMKKLAEPRKTQEAEARKLIASLPAPVMLSYGVHGNEISSPDAAMMTAYHLLASRNDKLVDSILANTLVLIDPTQNPDGRDRFVHHFEIAEGLAPDASPLAAEHNEPWPGGRTNHYYFDMNRDWFALTQPETRGRIKLLLDWYPLVFVDLHEMGGESTYYFAPEAVPYNPHLEKNQKDALHWFGRNNARWFDQFGFRYFTREVYDAFYPGYGASWPSFYGSVAMTYENASARGLIYQRQDETTFTFQQSVQKHFIASVSTCETASANREKLLANFWNYRKTAIEEGQKEPVREYILPRRGDVSLVDRLAAVLAAQGIEVGRSERAFSNGGKEYPAGSYVVSLAQPMKRMIRTLLDARVDMEKEFIAEQERRRKRKLPDEIYDVTGWSLPLQWNVECVAAAQTSQASFAPVKGGETPAGSVSGKAGVAYLIPWGTAAAGRFLAGALREDLRVLSADKPFSQGGSKYGAGTLIVPVKENPASVAATVQRIARQSGAEVTGVESSWVDEGPNFGSGNVQVVKKPRVAMAWDTPAAGGSAGHTRFVIERQFGYPVTPIRTRQLAAADLSKFQVLIFPDGGGYATELGAAGIRRLKDWVAAGGKVIGIGGAVAFRADNSVGLLDLKRENLPRATPAPAASAAAAGDGAVVGKILAKEEDYEKAIQADSEQPDSVAGVLVKAKVDPEHWLGHGVAPFVHALISGRAIYSPIKMDKGLNAAIFAGPDELVASGYMWEENRKQLAFKPLAVSAREGRGTVVGFTADPNYRAYMDGLNVLFLNALFRLPSPSRRAGEE